MINILIKEIAVALKSGLFLVALNSALTLPDICGKALYPEIKGNGVRYKKWYQEWVSQYEHSPDDSEGSMPYASADIVWDLRCSLTHQGDATVKLGKRNLARFALLKTNNFMLTSMSSMDGNGENRTLEIGIGSLCFKLCSCAKACYEKNQEKFSFNYTIEESPL